MKELQIYIYFAFTTMSTIGFGDFSPRSNEERMVGSFLLLLGVAIFSYILGILLTLIMDFKALVEPQADDAQLAMFFTAFQKFNNKRPLSLELQNTMRNHFLRRWELDKNLGFRKEYRGIV